MIKKKKSTKKLRKTPKVFEFKVSLEGTSPLVWRTFLAHEFIELGELHMLIQMTMGWEASHLYMFKFADKYYAPTEHALELNMEDADGVLLSDVLGSQKEFSYTYDFGDNWVHKVKIVNELEHDARMNYPVCTGGENACPPEDCGGIGGFEDLKSILSGKESDEKNEMLEWVGGFYCPTSFDPNFVNKHFLWADF